MLLSDRDIAAQLDAGRVRLDPYDAGLLQPSSFDVRLDRFFRLFDNHKYAVIDPAEHQPALTRLVETKPGEAFVLHPGEFVLGATFEAVTLPDDVAARLEGKSSLGRLGLLTHSKTSQGTKALLNLALSLVGTALVTVIADLTSRASVDWFAIIFAFVSGFIVSGASYQHFWKPTGVAASAAAHGVTSKGDADLAA